MSPNQSICLHSRKIEKIGAIGCRFNLNQIDMRRIIFPLFINFSRIDTRKVRRNGAIWPQLEPHFLGEVTAALDFSVEK